MPRFVLLRHDGPRGLHFDLMFEVDAVLRTWALPEMPSPAAEMFCEALPDHRVAYLDYEGPVSGDRGPVSRVDGGTYRLVRQTEQEWKVELSGNELAGRMTLRRDADDPRQWRLLLAAG